MTVDGTRASTSKNSTEHGSSPSVFSNWIDVLAGPLIYAVASIMMSVMPIVSSAVAHQFHLDESQKGFYASTEYVAVAIACFLSFIWVQKLNLSRVVPALAMALVLTCILAALAPNFNLLLFVRFISGFISGSLMSIAVLVIGKSANSDKKFGIMLGLSVCIAFFVAIAMPRLLDLFGYISIYLTLAVISLLILPFSFSVTTQDTSNASSALDGHLKPVKGVGFSGDMYSLLSLTAIFFEGAAAGVIFSNLGSIGEMANFTKVQIGDAVAVASFAGLVASFLPALIGSRIGFAKIIIISALSFLISIWLLTSNPNIWLFNLGMSVFWMAGTLLLIYYLASISVVDQEGSYLAVAPGSKMLGYAAGPFLAALLINHMGFYIVHVVALAALVLSVVLILIALSKPACSA